MGQLGRNLLNIEEFAAGSSQTAVRFSRLVQMCMVMLVGVMLTGCFFPETVTRNIRVIVQAELDGKIVEGSSVMGLRWQAGDSGRMYTKQNIEAVTLELPGRGTVYVTDVYMSKDGLSNRSYWPLLLVDYFDLNKRHAYGSVAEFPKLRSLQGRYPVEPLVGPLREMPVMVSFKDETKRETMFRVRPEDFPKVFGDDVRYVGMWFEFTDDEPTKALPQRLPVALKPNASFYTAFPDRKPNGHLIAAVDKAFPEKIGKSAFYERDY